MTTDNFCEQWITGEFRKAHKKQAKSVIISAVTFILYSEIAARVEPYVLHISYMMQTPALFPVQTTNFDVFNAIYGLSILLAFISAVRFSVAALTWRTIAKLHSLELRKPLEGVIK
jgi:FlaG/FlaF family flagellin (archaellin)